MRNKIIKRTFFYFSHIGWHCDQIFRPSGKLALFFEQIFQQILHIIEMGDDSALHRKYDLNIVRRFFIHGKRIVPGGKNGCVVLHRNDIFFFPDFIFFQIKYFDLVCTEIKPIDISSYH